MNLEDLAKKTISEINNEIEQKQEFPFEKQKEQDDTEANDGDLNEQQMINKQTNEEIQNHIESNKLEQKIYEFHIEGKESLQNGCNLLDIQDNKNVTLNEDIFLKNLRERILVLFEGLNTIKKDELETKLEITINFLEFLLANIEDRLKK
ncbi:2-oxoglutarate:acceptor oxidoreductase [Campylobacter sp. MIT 21-1685]|uniref:CiaD-like domain-containing protein n=1 Tax=unclassified Campylobacter TaxID=2593542 RepID=UPI00224B03F6|nr:MULTISPECIES: 2-oxoglutarate:acceptor oxidoreductase [unclassified Campylobacter]MCX2682740.1 2-oxoglutarate:acceptor oxidoreductase [Campylobacter sp. MIT 21-1684]MCX2751114.1 2-oxoglutarate:acceptor oxidoreductase [Campylobacter sp. MIT 21-1682]MCX2807221.1 2-oxoglutarate:acceptor oxidoreductase [Campylobacter sp. MIT 21-1685]